MTRAIQIAACLDCPLVAFGFADDLYCQHPDSPDTTIDSCEGEPPTWCPLRAEPLWLEHKRDRLARPTTSDVCPVCEGDDPLCPTCGGETGRRRRRTTTDDARPDPAYKPLRDALAARNDAPPESEIVRCGHDNDPGDKTCGECGAQLWSREDYESAAPETVAYHRDVEGATGAKGSDARRLDVVVALDGGGMAHETITTVECPACDGTGDADRNAQERVWNKCELCDGDGRVPEAVGAAYARGE